MQKRSTVLCLVGASLFASALSGATAAQPSVDKELAAYMEKFLPFDPQSKVTVEKTADSLPGFEGYKVRRSGRYENLKVDRVVFLSRDRRWLFTGETVVNKAPRAAAGEVDLAGFDSALTTIYRTKVRTIRVPERDAGALKAVAASIETGFGPVRIPGYISADSKTFFQGTLWNFQEDPRAERRRRIDLSTGRAQGSASPAVTIVEYADMECGYCKFRGMQLDRLLEVNAGIVSARRHYKFFPLWFAHPWAMKAASAADCLFRLGEAPAMFRFKELVYSRQETLTVAGIDELALTAAEAQGVATANFLSCYLQDESFARVRQDMEEGQRLEVDSTPTYFIDGTEISWIEDRVMEDFLRTKFPNLKGITYPVRGAR